MNSKIKNKLNDKKFADFVVGIALAFCGGAALIILLTT